jgi:hypothetical protein
LKDSAIQPPYTEEMMKVQSICLYYSEERCVEKILEKSVGFYGGLKGKLLAEASNEKYRSNVHTR